MSRTTRSWCPRSALPPLPPLIEADDSSIQKPHVDTKLKNEARTWQQAKHSGQSLVSEGTVGSPYRPQTASDRLHNLDRPQSGRPHWKPLPAEEATAAEADGPKSWIAQQAEFSHPRKQPRRKARGKAAAHRASAVDPSKPTLPPSPHPKDTSQDGKLQHSKRPRAQKKKAQNNTMASPTNGRASVYVPPHLRNRCSVDAGKADSAHSSGVAINCSPATPSEQSKAAITNTSKHDPTPNAAVHQHDSSSSPSTPEPVIYNGWDEPKAELPAATKNPGNPRWPRGPQPYKKTLWPKSKDMKYTPSSSDSGDGVSFKSNSFGDPNYDIKKLTDWNGDWLPAPETWAARRSHADRHFGAHIEQWMNTHTPDCIKPVYYPPDTFADAKELAPRSWLEVKVNGESLREIWKELLNPEKEPKPVDDNDLTDYLPWWELYDDASHTEIINDDGQDQKCFTHVTSYLNALKVPDARVDFDDLEHPSAPWMLASTEDKVQAKNKRVEEKHRKMMAKRSRPILETKSPVSQIVDRRLHPEANMYIRPVQATDVPGILEIYNYYINNTIFAPEFEGRTVAQIADRIQAVVTAGLPYLVAVSKSNKSRTTPAYVSEKIAGYINLDDYCDQSSLFRYTFEMELFVHPGFVSKGIGKCLVDRLLEMADTSYRARGGYEYVNPHEYLKTGPLRVIKTILFNVHHENGQDLDANWRGKFLSTCKFFRVGRLPKVGYKHDKVVDISIFAHHTKEDIDPSARPTVAG